MGEMESTIQGLKNQLQTSLTSKVCRDIIP